MEGLRQDSISARRLAEALGEARFRLVDVGCSGGLDAGWRVFGDRLSAFGFDPSVFEIDRLTAQETNPEVRYVNGFVSLPDDHPLKGANGEDWRTDAWRRVSASRTQQLQQARQAGEPPPPRPPPAAFEPLPETVVRTPATRPLAPASPPVSPNDQSDLMSRNLWREAALGGGEIHLPDFLAQTGFTDLDFIKIDVDGTDFEILNSLETALDGVLGVSIEVGYSGVGAPHVHSFHNIDRFMRQRGFDLLDLTVRRYTLSALPYPFLFRHPFAAQTTRGRPLGGDALYLRDFGHGCRLDPAAWSDAKLIKLAALYCLFGLLDHAAELLIQFRARLGDTLDIDSLLDVLTAEIQDMDPDLNAGLQRFDDYASYIAAYEADDLYFYGAGDRPHDQRMAAYVQHHEALGEAAAARAAQIIAEDRAKAAQAAAEAATAAARAAAEAAEAASEAASAHAAGLAAVLEAMTHTLSWRLTAPLRMARRLMGRG